MFEEIKIPNLFVVGAAKSGTTSLCRNLGLHPDIFLPDIKEPQYMVSKFVTLPRNGPGDHIRDDSMISDPDEYFGLYKDAVNQKYRIDGTVDMIFYPGVEKEIKKLSPDAKIIIMLRNPAERAYSAYRMLKDMHESPRERLSFEDGLKMEEQRLQNNYEYIWGYKKCGLYYEQVKRYVDEFGWENVKVILLDDIIEDNDGVYKNIFKFLDIPYMEDIGKNIFNVSGKNIAPNTFIKYRKLVKSNGVLKRIFKRIFPYQDTRLKIYEKIRKIFFRKVKMDTNTKKQLIEYFKDDIIKLSQLIDRDLSKWLVC